MKTPFYLSICLLIVSACIEAPKPASTESKKEQIAEEEIPSRFEWNFSNSIDEMTSEKTLLAHITSTDIADLDFPYQGGTEMNLFIRKTNGEYDAYIGVTSGQLQTDYDDPVLVVRFDNDEPLNFTVSESADSDPTILFFDDAKTFVDRLEKSKSIKIQCIFYNQGVHVYNFKTKGFKL
jgi:hypothetical protein